jgi:hypothetical protein
MSLKDTFFRDLDFSPILMPQERNKKDSVFFFKTFISRIHVAKINWLYYFLDDGHTKLARSQNP